MIWRPAARVISLARREHGLPTLRVADLVQDTRTLRVAQDEAKALLAKDPNLIDPAHRALSDEVERLL